MIGNFLLLSAFMAVSCGGEQTEADQIALVTEKESTSGVVSTSQDNFSLPDEIKSVEKDYGISFTEDNIFLSNDASRTEDIKEENIVYVADVVNRIPETEEKRFGADSYQVPHKPKGTKTRININTKAAGKKELNDKTMSQEKKNVKSVKEKGYDKRYVSVKTNLAYRIGAISNISADVQLHKNISLELPLNWSLWDIDQEHGLRLVLFQPETRWWMKSVGEGHFVGVHAHVGMFNVKWLDTRYQAAGRPMFGAGLTYGYSIPLSEHWGAEFLLGLGYANMKYDEFYNIDNGAKICTDKLNYCGITKLGVSLVYHF